MSTTNDTDRVTTSDVRTDPGERHYASGATAVDRDDEGGSNWWKWLLALLAATALAIVLFFALGGDADVDVDPGELDAPDVETDIDPPAVDIEAPDVDVDVDPGDVDVREGSADANAENDGD